MHIFKKNNFTASWCLLLILAVFSSCEKDAVTIDQTQETESSQVLEFRTTDGIEFDGEMFVFDSWEELEQVEAYLSEQVVLHNEQFSEQHPDLDDEAYNNLTEELGFDEFQPLTDFEQQYGIQSKRQQINEQVHQWLAESVGELDISTYPDNFPLLTPAIRSLFNIEGMVKIGEEIIQVNDEPIIPEGAQNCVKKGMKRDYMIHNHLLFAYVVTNSVYSPFPLVQRASSRVISLKRTGYSAPWKLFQTHLKAEISGVYRNNSCSQQKSGTSFSKSATSSTSKVSIISAQHSRLFVKKFLSGSCDIEAWGGFAFWGFGINVCI